MKGPMYLGRPCREDEHAELKRTGWHACYSCCIILNEKSFPNPDNKITGTLTEKDL